MRRYDKSDILPLLRSPDTDKPQTVKLGPGNKKRKIRRRKMAIALKGCISGVDRIVFTFGTRSRH